jgi:hypothetical protein
MNSVSKFSYNRSLVVLLGNITFLQFLKKLTDLLSQGSKSVFFLVDNWQQKVNPPIQEFKRANIYFNYTPQITRKAIASVQHRFIECNECIDEIPQNNSCFCPSIDQKNP